MAAEAKWDAKKLGKHAILLSILVIAMPYLIASTLDNSPCTSFPGPFFTPSASGCEIVYSFNSNYLWMAFLVAIGIIAYRLMVRLQGNAFTLAVVLLIAVILLLVRESITFKDSYCLKITHSGFAKLKPVYDETWMQGDGVFVANFLNSAGGKVAIKRVTISDYPSSSSPGTGCSAPSEVVPKEINPGEKFKVCGQLTCRTWRVSDIFQTQVAIEYARDGTSVNETGIIRGAVT